MVTIPHFDQPVFPVFYLAGAILFTLAFFRKGKQLKIGSADLLFYFSITVFASIFFSKTLTSNFIEQLPDFFATGKLNFDYTKSAGGGAAGALFALILCTWMLRKKNLQEVLFPGWLLGLATIKIGCLLEGCCFGIPIESVFGIHYSSGTFAFNELVYTGELSHHAACTGTLFPAQLLDIVVVLLLIPVTGLISKNNTKLSPAFTSLFLFVVYRIASDYLRALRPDEAISSYQILLLFLLFITFIIARYFRNLNFVPQQTDSRGRLLLLAAITIFVAYQPSWFTRAESVTIFAIAAPAAFFSVLGSQGQFETRRLTWATGTWLILLFMSFSPDSTQNDSLKFEDTIAQSTDPLADRKKYWTTDSTDYHKIQIGGMGGRWTDICGGVHDYGAGGLNYSYTHFLNRKVSTTLGVSGFIGSNSDPNVYAYDLNAATNNGQSNLPLITNTFGIRPYFGYDSRIVGFTLGVMMGQISFQDSHPPVNLILGRRAVSVIPVGSIRLGNRVHFAAEFGTHMPGPSDDPFVKIGIGWKGKNMYGNLYQLGVSTAGVYFHPQFGFRNGNVGAFVAIGGSDYFNVSATLALKIRQK